MKLERIKLNSIQIDLVVDWVKDYFMDQDPDKIEKIVYQALDLTEIESLHIESIALTLKEAIDDFNEAEHNSTEEQSVVWKCIELAEEENDIEEVFNQVLFGYKTGDEGIEMKLGIRKVAQLFKK